MKSTFYTLLISILFLLSSCQEEKPDTWIGHYLIHKTGNKQKHNISLKRDIISFSPNFKDLSLQTFPYDFLKDEKIDFKGTYDNKKEILSISVENKIMNFQVETFTKDSLVIVDSTNYIKKHIYKPLKRFSQKPELNRIFDLLTGNLVTLTPFNSIELKTPLKNNPVTKVELYENYTLLLCDLATNETITHWGLDVFDEELFLIFDRLGPFIQIIKTFDDHIIGYQPGINPKYLKIEFTPFNPKYKKKDLVGEWNRTNNNSNANSQDEPGFSPIEKFIFKDDIYERLWLGEMDSSNWGISRNGEYIMLNKRTKIFAGKEEKWRNELIKYKIIDLSEHELTIERHNPLIGDKLEIAKFMR